MLTIGVIMLSYVRRACRMVSDFSPHVVHVSLVIYGILFQNFFIFWLLYIFFCKISRCLFLWTVLRTNGQRAKVLTTFSGKCEFLYGRFWEESNRTRDTQTCMLVLIRRRHFRHLAPWTRKTDRTSETLCHLQKNGLLIRAQSIFETHP